MTADAWADMGYGLTAGMLSAVWDACLRHPWGAVALGVLWLTSCGTRVNVKLKDKS